MALKAASSRAPVLLVRVWPLLSLVLLVLATSLFGLLGPSTNRTVGTMMINLMIVVGLYSFVGLSGIFSFGHLAFTAVGAYVFALLATPVATKENLLSDLPDVLTRIHVPSFPAMIAAGLVASCLAFAVAIPLMRINGLSAALGTLTLLIVVNQVARNWRSVTNGTAGVPAVPLATTTTSAMVWALASMAAVFVFQQSRYGIRLRATREDEIAARSVAIKVPLERGRAFVLSAFICGVAGALSASLLGAFGPANFYLDLTFLTVVMLVIGGINSLAGAVVGTIVVSATSELLRRVERGVHLGPLSTSARPGLREIGLAGILLVILIVRPSGLMGGREIQWPGRRGRVAPPAAPAGTEPAAVGMADR